MARSDEQNRLARERAKENILQAAIAAFGERGVSGASVADITRRAGVAQGLANYHFGSKEQLVSAVIDVWFQTLFSITQEDDAPDAKLAGIIDGVLLATGFALPLQRAILEMQQHPVTHRLFAESEQRFAEQVRASEDIVRGMFAARGAEDPALEEVMLRTNLEGIVIKYGVYGDSFPLEDARRWMYRLYDLPAPTAPLDLPLPPRDEDLRPRAIRAVRSVG